MNSISQNWQTPATEDTDIDSSQITDVENAQDGSFSLVSAEGSNAISLVLPRGSSESYIADSLRAQGFGKPASEDTEQKMDRSLVASI